MTKAEATQVVIRQVRSVIGRDRRLRATLTALGLRGIGQEAQHTLSPSIIGMIDRVKQIVQVRKA